MPSPAKKRSACERSLDAWSPRQGAPADAVEVRGVWLRRMGEHVEVLVEIQRPDGRWTWRRVIREHHEGPFSHIVEPSGMLKAPEEPADA